jgi:hypothetical protein
MDETPFQQGAAVSWNLCHRKKQGGAFKLGGNLRMK